MGIFGMSSPFDQDVGMYFLLIRNYSFTLLFTINSFSERRRDRFSYRSAIDDSSIIDSRDNVHGTGTLFCS